jgi:hypothetical protein
LPPLEEEEEEEEDDVGPNEEQIEDELYESEADKCATTNLRMNVVMPQETVLIEEPDVDILVSE